MTESVSDLAYFSGTMRIVAVIVAALAAHDVVRNGLHVRRVTWPARAMLWLALVSLAASAVATAFRLAGEPWAQSVRELSHVGVSVGVIGVSYLVIRARTCAGAWLEYQSGMYEPHTTTGPGRDRTPEDTGWEDVRPLRMRSS